MFSRMLLKKLYYFKVEILRFGCSTVFKMKMNYLNYLNNIDLYNPIKYFDANLDIQRTIIIMDM